MKLIDLPYKLTLEEQALLRRSMLEENVQRGKLLAKATIVIEATLAIIDVVSSISNVHDSFHFSFYLSMYLTMILLNVLFLFFVKTYEDNKSHSDRVIKLYENGIISYITFFMVWGSMITLADQRLYGQLMAFVINIISGSVIFYLNNNKILIPYSLSIILLFAGLPFFQDSTNVLIGHYINLIIFLFFAWVASRILYLNYSNGIYSNLCLQKSNKLLEKEIAENKSVHDQLEKLNTELKRQALVDDLTMVPNRRALREYLDFMLNSQSDKAALISIIMIDIDYFKLFNDHYGHVEGDKVIRAVGQTINSAVRSSRDFAARFGGEEFIFIAFDTNQSDINQLAETIRNQVQELKIPHVHSKGSDYVTISLGTASGTASQHKHIEKLMKLADDALYSAKSSGRNCVKGSHSQLAESI